MRNRIRNILILMSACILGVFIFQGYWVYNAYLVRLQDFNRDINDALRTAIHNKQFKDVTQIFMDSLHEEKRIFIDSLPAGKRVFMSSIPAGKAIGGVVPAIKMAGRRRPRIFNFHATTATWSDSGQKSFARVVESVNGKVRFKLIAGDSVRREYSDSLSKDISDMLMVNNYYSSRHSLKSLDSVYRLELAARGISTPFQLDSVNMSPENWEALNEETPRPLHTFVIPFNPFSEFAVQAAFSSPLRHILLQMLGTLSGSVALLLLTVGCFIYMLRTILRQKKLSEVKNDFINNMTHELKTPIATVSAAVEAMQNFNALKDVQKTQTYLNISRQELQRLSDLVEKVLHIATEEKENFELCYEATDVNDLISSIVANHRLKANKAVDFSYTVLADPMVMADRTHLANALNNLVDNAIKYSGDPAVVHILITKETDRLKITVKDNGIGIPHNYQDSIFEKFFRVPTGNLHNVKGFGLGLSYVKKIVEMHGGSVLVKSVPEKGSEFTLEIPVN